MSRETTGSVLSEIGVDLTESSERLWLESTGLIAIDESYSLTTLSEWSLEGAENYVKRLGVEKEHETIRLMAKACIKFFPTETANEWAARRQLLSEAGVVTPRLYWRKGGTLIEEYIPYTFAEAWKIAEPAMRDDLKEHFITSFIAVLKAGFVPFSLHDARSHGNDVVLIDYGEDLGPPRSVTHTTPVQLLGETALHDLVGKG